MSSSSNLDDDPNTTNMTEGTSVSTVIQNSCNNYVEIPANNATINDMELINAVKNEDDEIVRLLLDTGASVNSSDEDGRTPLHYCAMKGGYDDDESNDVRARMAEMLLQKGAQMDATSKYGSTPLLIAVETRSLEVIQVLLKYGAKITEAHGRTLLFTATKNGDAEIVDLLLKYNANPNSVNLYGTSPFRLALHMHDSNVIRAYLKYNVDIQGIYGEGVSLLHVAAEEGFQDIIASLIAGKCDVNTQDKFGRTALHIAVERRRKEIINYLVENNANIYLKDQHERTPLHVAVLRDEEDLIDLFLINRPKIEADEMYICTIGAALKNKNRKVVQLLLDHASSIEINSDLIEEVVKTQMISIIKLFIDRSMNLDKFRKSIWHKYAITEFDGAEFDQLMNLLHANGFTFSTDDKSSYRLVSAVMRRGDVGLLSRLLKYIDNCNVVFEKSGDTYLHIACMYQEPQLVKLLVANNANVNAKNKKGKTPLLLSIQTLSRENIQILLLNGAVVEDSYLLNACQSGCIQIVQLLLDHGADVHIRDEKDQNVLHYCTMYTESYYGQTLVVDKAAIADLLLQLGIEVDAPSKDGITPIFAAVKSNNNKLVHVLLKHKADIYNEKGRTLLFVATKGGNSIIVDLLLQFGVHPDSKDSHGKSPFALAVALEKRELIKVYLNYNPDISVYGSGMNLFHVAAKEGFIDIIENLVKKNFNINSTDEKGRTALHFATQQAHEKVVDFLLDNGADINHQSLRGDTALEYVLTNFRSARHSFSEHLTVNTFNDHDDFADFIYHCRENIGQYKYVLYSFKRHVIRLQNVSLFVSENNLDIGFDQNTSSNSAFEEDEDEDAELEQKLEDFNSECQVEAEKLKTQKIVNDTSFYDFLRKNKQFLLSFGKNERMINMLNGDKYCSDYPIYRGLIKHKYVEILQRSRLTEELFAEIEKNPISILSILPLDCLELIFSYLNDKELQVLIEACKLQTHYMRGSAIDSTDLLKNSKRRRVN